MKKTATLFNFPTYYSLPSNIAVVLNYPQAIVPSKPTPTALDELETAEARIVYLRDREVVLYRIKRSKMWQVRFRLDILVLGRRKWLRASTKRTKLEDAKCVALDMFDEARFREKTRLAPIAKRYSDIARLIKKWY